MVNLKLRWSGEISRPNDWYRSVGRGTPDLLPPVKRPANSGTTPRNVLILPIKLIQKFYRLKEIFSCYANKKGL